jgi:uncharacterized protein VirK/YbjX
MAADMLIKHTLDTLMATRPWPGSLDAMLGFVAAARALWAWSAQRELLGLEVLRRYAGVGWANDPLFHLRHRHYLASGLTMRQRVDCALTHYRHEGQAHADAYKYAVYRGAGLALWTRTVGAHRYALRLQGATTLRHEGAASVVLSVDGARLCEMSFAWVRARLLGMAGDVVPFITRNQSVHHESPDLQCFRHDFPQNSPAYFCLAAMHGIATAHGQPHLAGIRHDCQIAYTQEHALSFRRSYCDLWRSFGGVESGPLAWAMPVPLVVTPLSAVKSKHRKRAAERRRHWAEIAESVAASIAAVLRDHTTERCRAMQVSSTSAPSRSHQSALEKISTSL